MLFYNRKQFYYRFPLSSQLISQNPLDFLEFFYKTTITSFDCKRATTWLGTTSRFSLNHLPAALGVSLVPTVMQMRCIVWEPSDWFRWGTMVRKSEVIGNGRKSSEKFGSRKSTEMVESRRRSSAVGSLRKWSEVVGEVRKSSGIKERHLSSYYTIVTSELIYVYEGWG